VPATVRICTPKLLPLDRAFEYAENATAENPINRPAPAAVVKPTPLQIAVMTSKYWGSGGHRFLTTFTEPVPTDLRLKLFSHLNAWYSMGANTNFAYTTDPGAEVRITLDGDGYWSYLGTDVKLIPQDEPTMSLQGFTMRTPDSEFYRVVQHEAGHTLGFPHEHMRDALVKLIDPEKAYAYFSRYGWDRQTVNEQVLTSLAERSLMATPPFQNSIMCYQLPGSITFSGRPIKGGKNISFSDAMFASKIYPKGRRR
jgi:hypothetical protein